MTFIGFYFLFYNLFQFFIIAVQHKIKTNKNSIKIIIWLVVGGSSDNYRLKSLFVNQNFITLFLCFYFNTFFLCFPSLPILFSRTPNRSVSYPQGYAYHRLGSIGLDSGLTYGGKFVSPTHRPRSTPQKQYLSASGSDFCKRLSEPQGLVRPEELGKLKKNSFTSSGLVPGTFLFVV
jgi:hypothetical protein